MIAMEAMKIHKTGIVNLMAVFTAGLNQVFDDDDDNDTGCDGFKDILLIANIFNQFM